MNQLAPVFALIPVMSTRSIADVAAIEKNVLKCPQIPITTHHILHAGMYSRTIVLPAKVILTGALIKIPTLLTISGDVDVSLGESTGIRITGTVVLPASAGRKQAFRTYSETTITMTFATMAMTIEQAEAEFTDDVDILFSRRDPELNTIIITGE